MLLLSSVFFFRICCLHLQTHFATDHMFFLTKLNSYYVCMRGCWVNLHRLFEQKVCGEFLLKTFRNCSEPCNIGSSSGIFVDRAQCFPTFLFVCFQGSVGLRTLSGVCVSAGVCVLISYLSHPLVPPSHFPSRLVCQLFMPDKISISPNSSPFCFHHTQSVTDSLWTTHLSSQK